MVRNSDSNDYLNLLLWHLGKDRSSNDSSRVVSVSDFHIRFRAGWCTTRKVPGSIPGFSIVCPFKMSHVHGPLAQSVERGADNAKVVSSILTRTREYFFVSIKPSEQNTNL